MIMMIRGMAFLAASSIFGRIIQCATYTTDVFNIRHQTNTKVNRYEIFEIMKYA